MTDILGLCASSIFSFYFNDTATTEIYTLSLHDALPISKIGHFAPLGSETVAGRPKHFVRSEEHTSELQSRRDLVCRLLLEKKKLSVQNATVRHYCQLYTQGICYPCHRS